MLLLKALALLPFHVSCLSNRSACRFATGDILGCIEDCSTALSILEIDLTKIDSTPTPTPTATATAISGFAATTDVPSMLLSSSTTVLAANATMLSSILPASGSEKRKSWVLKTVTRRGAALAQVRIHI